MLEPVAQEVLRAAFWPLYLAALLAGVVSATVLKRWCIARTTAALALGSLAMQALVWSNGGAALAWWQHFAIDLAVFWAVTLPPRHYWQAAIGAMVFAQLVLRSLWAMEPALGQFVWDASLLLGYGKCLVLLLWAGGPRVETVLGRASRAFARLVPASVKGELA